MKNLNVYFKKKKLISYYIIFETIKCIYKWLSAWLLTVKVIADKGRLKF